MPVNILLSKIFAGLGSFEPEPANRRPLLEDARFRTLDCSSFLRPFGRLQGGVTPSYRNSADPATSGCLVRRRVLSGGPG